MGGLYVLLMLGLVSGLSYLMTGGIAPNIAKNPENPKVVQIEDQKEVDSHQNLQLVNIGIKPTETPAPTSLTPAPTQTTQQCFDRSAIALLVDESYSMGNSDSSTGVSKLTNLKAALKEFLNYLSDDTVVGLYTFSANEAYLSRKDPRELIPFGKLANNKTALINAIDKNITREGGTHMKDGVKFVNDKLKEGKNNFPDYKFNTIFFTDGIPETDACPWDAGKDAYRNNCATNVSSHPQSPISEAIIMKNGGTNIYSVALYNNREIVVRDSIRSLMKTVSSSPASQYYVETPTSDNLRDLYRNISQKICP